MKKISIEMTDKQYACYEKAANELLTLGIPANPRNIIQLLIVNRDADQISSDFLTLMRSLVSHGKKKLRNTKETRNPGNELN